MRFRFAKWACYRLTEDADYGKKKNQLFSWSSFWSWRVCKQTKNCRIWGTKNPHAYIEKPAHPKWVTVWAIFPRKWARRGHYSQFMAIVIGSCWMNFCPQKLKRRILATFGFDRTTLPATQPKLHLMFCALFLKIAFSAAELMMFGHLGAVIWHRWTIICGVASKISVTPTSQRQLTL